MSTATAPTYPTARRVLKAEMKGVRHRRVLAVIAAYQDEGHAPSLREIAKRAKVQDWGTAQALIRSMERDGLVRVEWATNGVDRNLYEVLV